MYYLVFADVMVASLNANIIIKYHLHSLRRGIRCYH